MFQNDDFMKAMDEMTEVVKTFALLKEVLPPIQIKALKIKDKEYIAILIERKKQ